MPFCATDPATGELTGALRDYLNQASICIRNADLPFEPVPFPSTAAALEAMQNGEIDCVFPVNLCSYDAEEMGLLTVAPIMQTEMSVMMRAEDRPKVVPGVSLTVAVPEGNSNFETFVMDDIPNWTIRHFPDMESCYRAVAEQQADAALVCNYRTTALESLGGQYKLIPLPTGETMSLSFAVRRYDHALYSILEKTSNLTPNEDMEYALVGYLHSNRKTSLMDFLEDNWEGPFYWSPPCSPCCSSCCGRS